VAKKYIKMLISVLKSTTRPLLLSRNITFNNIRVTHVYKKAYSPGQLKILHVSCLKHFQANHKGRRRGRCSWIFLDWSQSGRFCETQNFISLQHCFQLFFLFLFRSFYRRFTASQHHHRLISCIVASCCTRLTFININ
jgi:hypothetical protein